MCCLRYEYDAYKDFKSRAPKRGAKVETPLGDGKVSGLNTPRETVDIRLAEGGSITVPLEAMECPGGGRPCCVSVEALEAVKKEAAASVLTGPLPELGESKPQSAEGEGGAKRRSRRKGRGKQPAAQQGAEQPTAGREAPKPEAAPRAEQGQVQGDGAGSSGRRRRRRRSSPKKGDNTGA